MANNGWMSDTFIFNNEEKTNEITNYKDHEDRMISKLKGSVMIKIDTIHDKIRERRDREEIWNT